MPGGGGVEGSGHELNVLSDIKAFENSAKIGVPLGPSPENNIFIISDHFRPYKMETAEMMMMMMKQSFMSSDVGGHIRDKF